MLFKLILKSVIISIPALVIIGVTIHEFWYSFSIYSKIGIVSSSIGIISLVFVGLVLIENFWDIEHENFKRKIKKFKDEKDV